MESGPFGLWVKAYSKKRFYRGSLERKDTISLLERLQLIKRFGFLSELYLLKEENR
mgnify:CR=1 FL=1